jgi:hypothetical protein
MDLSQKKHLSYYFSDRLVDDIVTRNGVDYIMHTVPEYILSNYDVIIYDYGLTPKNIEAYMDGHWQLLVTDSQKHHIKPLQYLCELIKSHIKKTGRENLKVIKIYRDMLPGKIDASYLDYVLELEEGFDIIASYDFTHKISDYVIRIQNTYDERIKFSNLSQQYLTFFEDLLDEVLGEDPKITKKAIKMAKKGASI